MAQPTPSEWVCGQCGARYSQAQAEAQNFTCPNPCLVKLFDQDGNQHSRFTGEAAERILPSRY